MDEDAAALSTLHSLEARLRRIEFLLAGTSEDPASELEAVHSSGIEQQSVSSRFHALERDLKKLTAKSRTVKEILHLHSQYPDIFRTSHPVAVGPPSTLTAEEKTLTVLSNATEYHMSSSQFTAIKDTPIPDPVVSVSLVDLLPRLQRAEVVQDVQAKKIAELRSRSANVLEQWFLVGVEGVNECFCGVG